MKVTLELDHGEVLEAIAQYVEKKTGVPVDAGSLSLQVKTARNLAIPSSYWPNWEVGTSRVSCEATERYPR